MSKDKPNLPPPPPPRYVKDATIKKPNVPNDKKGR